MNHTQRDANKPIARSGSLPDLKMSLKTTEHQTKVVERRIAVVEKHFPLIATKLQRYAVGTGKLRNKGDQLYKAIAGYADEEMAPSTKQGLVSFAEYIAAIQDQRDLEVHRLEDKLVEGFSIYETKCKQARNDVKNSSQLCTKEVKSFENLEKTQIKAASNRSRVAKAHAEFQKASGEANRSLRVLREQMAEFESQKIREVKKTLSDFVITEMEFLARSLELYSRAYQSITGIKEEEDLEQFNASMIYKPPSWGSAPSGLSYMGRHNTENFASSRSVNNNNNGVLEEEEEDEYDLNRTM